MQFYFSWIFTNISLWHTGKFFFIYSLFAFSFCKASMQPFLFCFLLIYFTLLFTLTLLFVFLIIYYVHFNAYFLSCSEFLLYQFLYYFFSLQVTNICHFHDQFLNLIAFTPHRLPWKVKIALWLKTDYINIMNQSQSWFSLKLFCIREIF